MPSPSPAVPPCSESTSASKVDAAENIDGCSRLYGPRFWYAYAASTLVTIASAILFRYADFVTILGGSELQLGWIVGLGMVGSVLARFSLGSAIDQHGPKRIWLGSLVVLAATCLAHLAITRCDGPEIYLLRLLYCTSIAGVFGASTTFISAGVNISRMAELLGILGTSGFVGMMVGTHLGDVLAGPGPAERWIINRMFIAAGLLVLAAIPFAWLSMRGIRRPAEKHEPATWAILWKYQPGVVLAVGVVAGAALSLPQTFLRTYAEGIHIPRIGAFFTVVALTAVTTRVVNRHVLQRLGLKAMVVIGLGLLALAQVLFLVVDSEWEFLFPGLPYGMGQAILYPVVAALGTATFPARYRGMGITLVLAVFDVGQLLAGPLAGGVIHGSEALGLPGYPTLFLATSATLIGVGAIYWRSIHRPASAPTPVQAMAVRLNFPVRGGRPVAVEAQAVCEVAIRQPITPGPRAGSSRSTTAARR